MPTFERSGPMAYLLRKLSNKDAWADVAESPLWEQGDCPPEALVQVFDNRSGVSTWRVCTSEDIERVVAVQALARSTIADFAYCLIDEEYLRQQKIETSETPQRTIDKNINGRHVDLVNLTGKQIIELARLINSQFSPFVMTRSEILEVANRCFAEGKFDREFLFLKGNKGREESEIAVSKDLLVNLWKKGEIGFT
jgi:hypothetical protein